MKQKSSNWFLLLFMIMTIGCSQNHSPVDIVQATKTKLSKAESIRYKYRNETDNRFNETKFIDSAEVIYYKTGNSFHGFGLKALHASEEYSFDGLHFEKFKHESKIKVVFDAKKIEQDSNYFTDFPFFSISPMSIKDYTHFDTVLDTTLNNEDYFILKSEARSKSKTDSSKVVLDQTHFFVNAQSKDITQVRDLIIRNDETLQLRNHYFFDYQYDNANSVFERGNKQDISNYQTIDEADDYEEFTYTPIKEGTLLTKKTYKDLNGKTVELYGKPKQSSLIMFSFIGCTACEIALKDFKEKDYNFTDKINLYYSSFQNTNASLKKYLEKKEFPFTGFGKESEMINDFSLYHAPSFVLIDPNGEILKVIEGYDDEIRNTLFTLLLPNQM